jgi:hypothetical protein
LHRWPSLVGTGGTFQADARAARLKVYSCEISEVV